MFFLWESNYKRIPKSHLIDIINHYYLIIVIPKTATLSCFLVMVSWTSQESNLFCRSSRDVNGYPAIMYWCLWALQHTAFHLSSKAGTQLSTLKLRPWIRPCASLHLTECFLSQHPETMTGLRYQAAFPQGKPFLTFGSIFWSKILDRSGWNLDEDCSNSV